MNQNESIEEIILRHSGRGMNLLHQHLEQLYCRHAARRLLALRPGRVLLTTGFYVAGHAETDGPPGTLAVANALRKLGYRPMIVTDQICRGLFEPEGLEVRYVPLDAEEEDFRRLLEETDPVCLISIERCGRNLRNDYANMRGVSIAAETAPMDLMFELARKDGILTIGVGDGGNEIGMGNLQDVIAKRLALSPCTVRVDELIIATTSNWGAYGLVAWLDLLQEQPVLPSWSDMSDYLDRIVSMGCVDGVTGQPVSSVDGFPPETGKEIFTLLHQVTDARRFRVPA